MPQTMLGMLALALAMLLAMQQQQAAVNKQMNRIKNELAVHSTTVAEDLLNLIGSMAFDQATADPDVKELTSPSQLTPAEQFGTSEGQPNDIDDFHGSVGDQFKQRIVRRTDPVSGEIRTDTLHFDVDVRVAYVSEQDLTTEVSYRTKAKKAEVTVYSTLIPRPDTVRLSRSFVCGSKCAW